MHDILCTAGVSVDAVYQQFILDAPRTEMNIRVHSHDGDGSADRGDPVARNTDPKIRSPRF